MIIGRDEFSGLAAMICNQYLEMAPVMYKGVSRDEYLIWGRLQCLAYEIAIEIFANLV